MKTLIQQITLISRKFSDDCLGVYAAQAAFFITLSALPLLMLLISLVRFILPMSYEEILSGIYELTPTSLHVLMEYILSEAFRKSSATVLSFSTITMLWSASRCIYALRLGLNNIHHIKKRRGYFYYRISSIFYMLGMFVVVLFSLIVLVFGNKFQGILSTHLPWLARITERLIGLRSIPAILLLTLFFLCIYALLPDRRSSFRSQLPGAMFSTAGWMLLSFGFSFYVDHFSGYSMYGSLAAVTLAMLWIYLCMYLVLIGGELNILLLEKPQEPPFTPPAD